MVNGATTGGRQTFEEHQEYTSGNIEALGYPRSWTLHSRRHERSDWICLLDGSYAQEY